jgi:hypothetical protein
MTGVVGEEPEEVRSVGGAGGPGTGSRAVLALLLALSTLASLAAVEVALRVLRPFDDPAVGLDEELIYAPLPGARFRYVQLPANGGAVVRSRFNSAGYRGDELQPRGPGRLRVAVYGDSMIQGSYTPRESSFCERLEAELAVRLGSPVEVVNAGVDGYGPDQVERRVRRELPTLDPDHLVVAVFADNDFGDLMRNKFHRVVADGQVVENRFVIPVEMRERYALRRAEMEQLQLRRAAALLSDPRWVSRQAKLLVERRLGLDWALLDDVWVSDIDFAREPQPWLDIWLERSHQEYQAFVVDADDTVGDIHGDHYDADLALEPASAAAAYKRALMAGVMGRLADTARRAGVPLLLLVVPSPIDACEGYDWQVDVALHPEYRRRRLSEAVVTAARRHRVPHLELFDLFHGPRCNSLYHHEGNNHWNEAGQALAAERVAAALLR